MFFFEGLCGLIKKRFEYFEFFFYWVREESVFLFLGLFFCFSRVIIILEMIMFLFMKVEEEGILFRMKYVRIDELMGLVSSRRVRIEGVIFFSE